MVTVVLLAALAPVLCASCQKVLHAGSTATSLNCAQHVESKSARRKSDSRQQQPTMLLWRAGVRARWSAATPPAVHRGTRGGGVRIHTYSHHHYRNSGGSSSSSCYAMQTLRRRVVLHTGSTRLHGVRGIHTTASPLAGRLNAQQQAKRDRAKHWLRHQVQSCVVGVSTVATPRAHATFCTAAV